ncbi:MAG: 23S rRNA (guanosine(2251)-2'-O)-methyltransferase RlmB [Pseudomonadota bacterium]
MAETEWIIGVNAVEALLAERPGDVATVELAREAGRRISALGDQARAAGISCKTVKRRDLDRRFPDQRHQGVVASARLRPLAGIEDLPGLVAAPDALVLVLDQIQDPRNLGACIRSAAAAGVDAVVFPKDRAAPLTSVARKAAAGGAERVPLVQVTNLASALDLLKDAGVWLVGAAGEAEQSLWQVDLTGRMGIVLGSEGAGLRRLTRERCDFLARIPMPGGFESLNVSVATGVFLFEAIRQRDAPS